MRKLLIWPETDRPLLRGYAEHAGDLTAYLLHSAWNSEHSCVDALRRLQERARRRMVVELLDAHIELCGRNLAAVGQHRQHRQWPTRAPRRRSIVAVARSNATMVRHTSPELVDAMVLNCELTIAHLQLATYEGLVPHLTGSELLHTRINRIIDDLTTLHHQLTEAMEELTRAGVELPQHMLDQTKASVRWHDEEEAAHPDGKYRAIFTERAAIEALQPWLGSPDHSLAARAGAQVFSVPEVPGTGLNRFSAAVAGWHCVLVLAQCSHACGGC